MTFAHRTKLSFLSQKTLYSLLESRVEGLLHFLAGMIGLEPMDTGVKVLRLTTWRHPYNDNVFLADRVGFEPTQRVSPF